jgi:subtilisin family serine protease
MRLRASLVLSAVLLSHAASTSAQPPIYTPIVGTKVDPALRSLFGFRDRTGVTPLAYLPSERFERDGVTPVVLRFNSAPDLAKYARAGVEALTPLLNGGYAAKIGKAQLAMLEADPNVALITVDLPRRAPRPLVESAKETGIDAARRALRAKDGTLLDGTGVKIADIDSGTFVLHPALYRADAGVFAWVDVDGDGKLTPGVDGVDLDGSGDIDATEVLKTISVKSPERSGTFDVALDYLYLDTNGNGARDFGKGFTEDTPAHGEPIFLVDDVDHDGKLATTEKLLRLGTSKIAAARASRTYTRGNATYGISAYGNYLLKNDQILDYSSHGTGVAGILAGGVADRSRLLGLAPGADLVVVGYGGNDPDGTTASVQWAIDQKADVILTEYAPYNGYPLDGSTEEETLLSAAVEKGITVVNPAGNLAIGYKHRSAKLATGANTIALKTDKSFNNAPYVSISMLYRGDARALTMKLQLPDATSVDIPADSTGGSPMDIGGGRLLDVVRRTTSRGTHEIHISLYAWADGMYGKLPSGKYSLSVDSDAAFDAELYCGDSNNSWAYGFTFEENTPTRTICHPATNDRGIAVAAYTLHGDDPFGGGTPGRLASYSSIGPRIDGNMGIDLAAPDNPFSTSVPGSITDKSVTYAQFGGTSGAGPHVAAALALLKQLNPMMSADALQKKVLDTASREGVSSDEARWGKGKLDVTAALGITRTTGAAPNVKLNVPEAVIGKPIELKLETDGVKARWDLDYDGTWDNGWEAIAPKTISADAWLRVEVLSADGTIGGTSARIVFKEKADAPLTPASEETSTSGCGCGTTGSTSTPALLAYALGYALVRRRSRARRLQ